MAVENSGEEVFLAERIVDSGFGQQDGKRYYKVKWVRYTWEAEGSINHLKELIDLFWTEHGGIQNFSKAPTNKCEINSLTTATSKGTETSQIPSVLPTVNDQENNAEDETTSTMETDELIKDKHTPSIGNEEAAAASSKSAKSLTCDICFRTYSSQQSLKSHKRVHTQEKPYKCEKCEKCFGEKSTLKRHMYIHLESKPFKCNVCERGFSDKSTLRRHVVTHSGAKRFQCDVCNKRFTRNEHLRQHMYIHTAEKIYKCDICFKTFRQRSTLKNHTLIHRAESNYKCDTCNAVFTKAELYDKHILWCTTTNGIALKCNICQKRFQDKDQLAEHVSTHTNEIFQCEQCNQTFTSESERDDHSLSHSPKKPYHCTVCGQQFLQKVSLVSHISTQHPDQSLYELMSTVDYDLNEEMNLSGFGTQSTEASEISTAINNVDCDPLTETSVDVPSFNDLTVGALTKTNLNESALDKVVEDESAESKSNAFLGSTSSVQNTTNSPIHNLNITSLETIATNESQTMPPPSLLPIDGTQSILGNNTNNALQIDLPENGGLQPGDNQLLQVQIIHMQDGNRYVQSIQTIVPENAAGYEHSELIVDDQQIMAITEGRSLADIEKTNNLVTTNLVTPNMDVETRNNLVVDESEN